MLNILIYLILFFCFKTSIAQTYVEPFVGYAADAREKQNLNMLNVGIQVAFAKQSVYEFAVGAINSFGIKRKGSDSSFTLNPSLPLYNKAEKTIHSTLSGVYTNHRLRFFKTGANQYVNFNFLVGIRFQRVIVKYELKNQDYVVLNPETNYKRLGLYAGAGLEYIYLLKKGRLILQSNILTPSLRRKNEKVNSFNQAVPFNFNLGYSIELRNK